MQIDGRKRFTLRVPKELFARLQKESAKVGTSTNALILCILGNWKEEQERKQRKK